VRLHEVRTSSSNSRFFFFSLHSILNIISQNLIFILFFSFFSKRKRTKKFGQDNEKVRGLCSNLTTEHSKKGMYKSSRHLELGKVLGTLDDLLLDLEDVEADSLGQGTALTNSDRVTLLNSNEGRRHMSGQVLRGKE
jgi:hypothetical protein